LTTEANPLPPAATTDILSKGEVMKQEKYIEQYWKSLRNRYKGFHTYRGQDVDDIISFATLTLVEKIAKVMAVYPDPTAYAGKQFSSVAVDFRRRQMAQRGEGARGERRVVSANDDEIRSQIEGIEHGSEDRIAEQMDNKQRIDEVMEILSVEQQRIVNLHGEGFNVTEIAKILGRNRATVSRALSAARCNVDKTFSPAA
jgi:RNA polymerase sigma factor (sigma-70 family)